MKYLAASAILAFAVMTTTIAARAEQPAAPQPAAMPAPIMAPAPGLPELTPQQHEAMAQSMMRTHQQLEQLHKLARAQTLAALTPAHKTLLAQVVGNLAIAPEPDVAAAIRQIDAALTPQESQAILNIHANLRSQSEKVMSEARAQAESALTAEQKQKLGQLGNGFGHGMAAGKMLMLEPGREPNGRLDAGAILLHLTAPIGEPEMHGFFIAPPAPIR